MDLDQLPPNTHTQTHRHTHTYSARPSLARQSWALSLWPLAITRVPLPTGQPARSTVPLPPQRGLMGHVPLTLQTPLQAEHGRALGNLDGGLSQPQPCLFPPTVPIFSGPCVSCSLCLLHWHLLLGIQVSAEMSPSQGSHPSRLGLKLAPITCSLVSSLVGTSISLLAEGLSPLTGIRAPWKQNLFPPCHRHSGDPPNKWPQITDHGDLCQNLGQVHTESAQQGSRYVATGEVTHLSFICAA